MQVSPPTPFLAIEAYTQATAVLCSGNPPNPTIVEEKITMPENSEVFTDSDRAKFAGLVARAWNDPELAARYGSDSHTVLAENGIVLPAGVDAPAIPTRPEGDISIEELDMVSAGLGVSSLLSAACPVSSFSSISN